MLDLREIENTIEQLEGGTTTFDTCLKLASLYVVRDRLLESVDADITEAELKDILPQYKRYCEIKRKYQIGELSESAVLSSMILVCKEIKEFLQSLYSGTDMSEERNYIYNMIKELYSEYK